MYDPHGFSGSYEQMHAHCLHVHHALTSRCSGIVQAHVLGSFCTARAAAAAWDIASQLLRPDQALNFPALSLACWEKLLNAAHV
jgi:hypothetical protein